MIDLDKAEQLVKLKKSILDETYRAYMLASVEYENARNVYNKCVKNNVSE